MVDRPAAHLLQHDQRIVVVLAWAWFPLLVAGRALAGGRGPDRSAGVITGPTRASRISPLAALPAFAYSRANFFVRSRRDAIDNSLLTGPESPSSYADILI